MTPKAPKGDAEVALKFASLLLQEEVPDGTVAHLFALPSAKCEWASNSGGLTSGAMDLCKGGEDVYVGISLRKKGLGRFSRGKGDDLTHVLGVGIDIDVDFDGVVSKKKRFPSVEAAIACAATAVEPAPTIIVHSGGGVHLWWLYKEPFDITNAQDRNLAANVSMEWNKRIADAARYEGDYSVDSTFDLERVLRFPGTFNRKIQSNPRPVYILESDSSLRYGPQELADFLGIDPSDISRKTVDERIVLGGKLTLDSNAEPPLAKKLALLENDERFRSYLRRDTVCHRWIKDTSASGYDLALANIAVRAGWADQEIADLLISNRRAHGDDLKLRERYYSMTIAQARKGYDGTSRSSREIERREESRQKEAIEDISTISDANERRSEIMGRLAKSTGVDVVRIVSNGRDPARYRVYLRNGSVLYIESTKALRLQDTWFEKALETNSKVPVEPMSAKNWRLLIVHLSEVLEFEPESDSLLDAISEYIERAVEISGDAVVQRGGMLSSGRPIIMKNGCPAIHLSSFSRWLSDCGRKIEPSLLKSRLLAYRFVPKTLSYRVANQGSSRVYWVAEDRSQLKLANTMETDSDIVAIDDDRQLYSDLTERAFAEEN